jgi:hypothetical protein
VVALEWCAGVCFSTEVWQTIGRLRGLPLVRVSAFLGVFTGFYFIVSSSSDPRLRADLAADHEEHVRACLAVRHAYWELLRTRS